MTAHRVTTPTGVGEHTRRRGRARGAARHGKRGHALIVAGSMFAGIVAAFTLVAGPFAGGGESAITAAVLLGFALGWSVLAACSCASPTGPSTGQPSQPRRWP